MILTSYKLTIMTGNNVHFQILNNIKLFANLWWLNFGTESDLSTVWIFYCGICTFMYLKSIQKTKFIIFFILQLVDHDRKWCPFFDPQKYRDFWHSDFRKSMIFAFLWPKYCLIFNNSGQLNWQHERIDFYKYDYWKW